jgi:Abnormal spindle-like microcephaly-assoc'd, ASPM-SPD-2-Hydin
MPQFSGLCRPGWVLRASWRRTAVAVLAAAVVLSGAGAAAAKPAPSALAFTPSAYDYGQVAVGKTASQTFTLANSGGSASGALTLALSGPSAFTTVGDTCSAISLGPGQSCTVTVQFAPVSAGTDTATLTATGKKTSAAATLSLTGTGAVLYWTDFSNGTFSSGTINEASLDGSNPQALITGQNGPFGVAVDSGHIYWANFGSGTINEASLDGSNPQALITGQSEPAGVAAGP